MASSLCRRSSSMGYDDDHGSVWGSASIASDGEGGMLRGKRMNHKSTPIAWSRLQSTATWNVFGRSHHNNHKGHQKNKKKTRNLDQRRSLSMKGSLELTNTNGESDDINPYRMLQIRKDATQAEIKTAYRRHALWYHPSRCTQSATVLEQERRTRVFTILAACCETLLERESRARLDLILSKGPRSSVATTATTNSTQSSAPRPAFRNSNSSTDIPLLELSLSYSTDSQDDDDDDVATGWCRYEWPCGNNNNNNGRDNDRHSTTNQQQQQQHNHKSRRRSSSISSSRRRSDTFHSVNSRYVRSMSSGSTTEDDHIHYTQTETDRLFGGPLSLMYRARMFRPFSDPYTVFDRVFGSAVFPSSNEGATTSPLYRNANSSNPQQCRSAAWTGTCDTLPDGSTVYTTSRILHGRKLVKRETISVDKVTGKKKSTITVTSEELPPLDHENKKQKDNNKQDDSPQSPKKGSSFLDNCICYLDCCSPLDLLAACDFATEDYYSFGTFVNGPHENRGESKQMDPSSPNIKVY